MADLRALSLQSARTTGAWQLVLCLLLGAVAPVVAQTARTSPQQLAEFASRTGLHQVEPFVNAVTELRSSGQLPPRYVSKEAARAHGWRGGGLCNIWPGQVIGGDPFGNFGGQLPTDHRYFEADLDSTCRGRGPSRLIYSSDGLIFVTTDHYRSFVQVP